jgi:hypothetical protein
MDALTSFVATLALLILFAATSTRFEVDSRRNLSAAERDQALQGSR